MVGAVIKLVAKPQTALLKDDHHRFVVGDADRLTPPSKAYAIVDAIHDCRLAVLPAVGHVSAMEAPRDVAAQLVL